MAANQKLCLRNAVQDGAVNVAPGGSLSVVGSTITGAITLKSGYLTFDFCGSKTIRGATSAAATSDGGRRQPSPSGQCDTARWVASWLPKWRASAARAPMVRPSWGWRSTAT